MLFMKLPARSAGALRTSRRSSKQKLLKKTVLRGGGWGGVCGLTRSKTEVKCHAATSTYAHLRTH